MASAQDECVSDGVDVSDTSSAALHIGHEERCIGGLDSADRHDWYAVDIPVTGIDTLSVRVCPLGSWDVDLFVYYSPVVGGLRGAWSSLNGVGSCETIHASLSGIEGAQAGHWLIDVKDFSGAGSYDLTVSY